MNWVQLSLLLYGLLNIGLGIAGAAKGSMVSLYAAGGAGLLAVIGALIARSNPKVGYILGALVCVALLGRFVPALMKEFNIYPGGIAAAASIVMLVILVAGHFMDKR